MLWINKTGIPQIFYDPHIEPISVRPGFSINDLDAAGGRPKGFSPLMSIYEILDQKPNASICLARVSSIGDILLLFPLFFRIRELYPECHLMFASVKRYLEFIKYIDFIEPVEEKKLNTIRPDFGYDFNITVERAERQGWGKLYHRSEIYAKIVGVSLEEHYTYTLPYSEIEKMKVLNLLQQKSYISGPPLIGFQLRGASPQRTIPTEKLKRVINRLTGIGAAVVLLDGDKNIGWGGPNIINMCGELNVLELVAMVDMCDLVVSTDSGVTHIAGAINKKNIAFFGGIPAENRVRYPECIVVDLAGEFGCSPCWESGEKCVQGWDCLVRANEDLMYNRIVDGLT